MDVQMLYAALNFPGRMVIKGIDSRFYEFNVTPCRKLTAKDLTPLPGFIAKGNQAQEAPAYLYDFYDLFKIGVPLDEEGCAKRLRSFGCELHKENGFYAIESYAIGTIIEGYDKDYNYCMSLEDVNNWLEEERERVIFGDRRN